MIDYFAQLIAGIVLVSVLAYLAVRLGAIDWPGALLGEVIAILAFVAGGIFWLIIIVLFFVISSAFTRYRYEYKRKLGSAQEKGGRRSWPNTLANGGIAACASVAEILTHSNVFAVAFVTSVAAALSDTLATEIGLLSNSRPRLLTNLREFVSPGTSGGVTGLGEVVALLSSSGMAFVGLGTKVIPTATIYLAGSGFFAVVAGAMIGTTLDSFLGSTVQSVNKCVVCGALTENTRHHDKPTILVRGSRLLDNNSVNLVGILVGAASSVIIYALLVPGTF
jgi:uncharacterized protein (TIGR00297 family)